MRATSKRGFIGLIITLVVALALAKFYFDWNFIDFFNSIKTSEVFIYLKKFALLVWGKFLVGPVVFIWNFVFVDIIWKTFVSLFDMLKVWVDSQS
jgi:hypothetical protein